ncbi:hypothetical protein HY733_01445 [Candidatus Uhrbacteria bacterium]|nr:hypothetical protein [Candidatus Uhrbacteria bacterium]
MDHERWEGSAAFSYDQNKTTGILTIQRIQSVRNLVTIEGLGQGKVTFDRDGMFQGCWAMGNQIFDVVGSAQGDQRHWEGHFEIRTIDGNIVVTGSFQAKKTHD